MKARMNGETMLLAASFNTVVGSIILLNVYDDGEIVARTATSSSKHRLDSYIWHNL